LYALQAWYPEPIDGDQHISGSKACASCRHTGGNGGDADLRPEPPTCIADPLKFFEIGRQHHTELLAFSK
jgi:hypothetical protein